MKVIMLKKKGFIANVSDKVAEIYFKKGIAKKYEELKEEPQSDLSKKIAEEPQSDLAKKIAEAKTKASK